MSRKFRYPIRSYKHALQIYEDAAQALVMAGEDSTLNTTLNLVGKNHLILDLAKQISDNIKVVDYKDDNRSYKVDNSRILEKLKWRPIMDINS